MLRYTPLGRLEGLGVALGSAVVSFLDPERADMVALLGEVTGGPALARLRGVMRGSAEGRAVLAQRPLVRGPLFDAQAMVRTMPLGSFGAAYGLYMSDHGFSADARTPVRFVADAELAYVMTRYREVHDFLHVLSGLPTTVVMRGILAGAFFGAEVFIPLALVEQRGLTITVAGLALSVSALGWWMGSYAQGRIPESTDRSSTVRTGALIVAVGLVSLPLCLVPALPPMVCVVSYFVASVGMGLCFPSIAVQTLRLSPVAEQGVNSASLQISDAILSALALGLLGAVHAAAVTRGGATTSTYDAIWWAAAAVALAGAVLAARMKPVSAVPAGAPS